MNTTDHGHTCDNECQCKKRRRPLNDIPCDDQRHGSGVDVHRIQQYAFHLGVPDVLCSDTPGFATGSFIASILRARFPEPAADGTDVGSATRLPRVRLLEDSFPSFVELFGMHISLASLVNGIADFYQIMHFVLWIRACAATNTIVPACLSRAGDHVASCVLLRSAATATSTTPAVFVANLVVPRTVLPRFLELFAAAVSLVLPSHLVLRTGFHLFMHTADDDDANGTCVVGVTSVTRFTPILAFEHDFERAIRSVFRDAVERASVMVSVRPHRRLRQSPPSWIVQVVIADGVVVSQVTQCAHDHPPESSEHIETIRIIMGDPSVVSATTEADAVVAAVPVVNALQGMMSSSTVHERGLAPPPIDDDDTDPTPTLFFREALNRIGHSRFCCTPPLASSVDDHAFDRSWFIACMQHFPRRSATMSSLSMHKCSAMIIKSPNVVFCMHTASFSVVEGSSKVEFRVTITPAIVTPAVAAAHAVARRTRMTFVFHGVLLATDAAAVTSMPSLSYTSELVSTPVIAPETHKQSPVPLSSVHARTVWMMHRQPVAQEAFRRLSLEHQTSFVDALVRCSQ